MHALDQVDVALIGLLREHPRAGALELSRRMSVARATVQARLRRLEAAGVITGYGPDVDLEAAGHPVLAFVTLEIAQGALDDVAEVLEAIPAVLEAFVTTGTADVLAKVAASSHHDLQDTLLRISGAGVVVRSTSVMVLSVVVPPRVLPLLQAGATHGPTRAPAFRRN